MTGVLKIKISLQRIQCNFIYFSQIKIYLKIKKMKFLFSIFKQYSNQLDQENRNIAFLGLNRISMCAYLQLHNLIEHSIFNYVKLIIA